MSKLLVAITVALAATCLATSLSKSQHFNPYEELNRVLRCSTVKQGSESPTDKECIGSIKVPELENPKKSYKHFPGVVKEYMESDNFKQLNSKNPDLGKLAQAYVKLDVEGSCGPKNMEGLRQIVEMGLKYNKRVFTKQLRDKSIRPRLTSLVLSNIHESINALSCFDGYTDSLKDSELEKEFSGEDSLKWLDSLNCVDCNYDHVFFLALDKLKKASLKGLKGVTRPQVASLLKSEQVSKDLQGLVNFEKMQDVFDKHVIGPCMELKGTGASPLLKTTVDFSLAMKIAEFEFINEKHLNLYKWASRYIMCEFLIEMDKNTLVDDMLKAYEP